VFSRSRFREHSGKIQGRFRAHSGDIQGISREHAGHIQGTCRGIQGTNYGNPVARGCAPAQDTCREHSEHIQGTFNENSGTFKEPGSAHYQHAVVERQDRLWGALREHVGSGAMFVMM
jgi:hypothetical protein